MRRDAKITVPNEVVYAAFAGQPERHGEGIGVPTETFDVSGPSTVRGAGLPFKALAAVVSANVYFSR